jgi:hypothetical protein
MQIAEAGEVQLTDAEGRLLQREEMRLTEDEAHALRIAARMLRGKRFRMIVRCDVCFEDGRGDGMRGVIDKQMIDLECRCRTLRYVGETVA